MALADTVADWDDVTVVVSDGVGDAVAEGDLVYVNEPLAVRDGDQLCVSDDVTVAVGLGDGVDDGVAVTGHCTTVRGTGRYRRRLGRCHCGGVR